MKLSKRVTLDYKTPMNDADSNPSSLSNSELSSLDALYKKIVPRYNELCEQYERARTMAINARRKSVFPNQVDWKPVCGFQDVKDSLLIQGPKPTITEKKKVEHEDVRTGKKSVFTSLQNEPHRASGRHISSIVQIFSNYLDSCTIAYISKLFVHKFGEDMHILALLKVYAPISEESPGLFWSEIDTFKPESVILPLNNLSPPLVVAFEENRIYFLNCKL